MRIALLLLAVLPTTIKAQSAPRWEYGILAQSQRGDPMTWRWSAGDSVLRFDVAQDVPFHPNDPPHGVAVHRADSSIAFLDRLGADGWELVSTVVGSEIAWVFKRRRNS